MTNPDSMTSLLGSRSLVLWFGVLAPPLAWGAHLVLGDLIFELGCAPGVGGRDLFGLGLEAWALIQSVVLGAVVVAAGMGALAAWRRLQRHPDGTRWSRAHAMALAGVASGALYGLLVLFGLVSVFFLDGCVTPL